MKREAFIVNCVCVCVCVCVVEWSCLKDFSLLAGEMVLDNLQTLKCIISSLTTVTAASVL